jgi:hypothetical protein
MPYLAEQNIDHPFLSSSIADCKVTGEGGGLWQEYLKKSNAPIFSWLQSNKLMFENT